MRCALSTHLAKILLGGMVALPCATPANAAIFASDLVATRADSTYTLHYLLNEPAINGAITVAAVATPGTPLATISLSGAQLAKGPHDVAFTPSGLPSGQYAYSVQVSAAQHNAYDIITPATPIGSGATVAYGLRVNRVSGSLGYGHIYMADFQGTANTLHPLREFAADGSFLQSLQPDHASSYTTVGTTIGEDGSLYVCDQDTDSIRHYVATGSPVKPTWTLDKTYTGPVLDAGKTPPLGSFATRGFQVFGNGDGATVFLTDYSTYPNQVEVARLGDTTQSSVLDFQCAFLTGRLDQILVAPDRKSIYVASGILPGSGRHINRWIYGLNPATSVTEWYLDPAFAENNSSLATLAGNARGLAFSASGDLLWVTQNGGANSASSQNYIAKVTLTPLAQSITRAKDALAMSAGITVPTMTKVRLLDTNADQHITVADAVSILRTPSSVGAVVERIPMPGGAVLPVTMDVDPKGNLVVGANSSPAADGSAADVFYIVAPPDYGSQDKAISAPFTIG